MSINSLLGQNYVICSPSVGQNGVRHPWLTFKRTAYQVQTDQSVPDDRVMIGSVQRGHHSLALFDQISAEIINRDSLTSQIEKLHLQIVNTIPSSSVIRTVHSEAFVADFIRENPIVVDGQALIVSHQGIRYVVHVSLVINDQSDGDLLGGTIRTETKTTVTSSDPNVTLLEEKCLRRELFQSDFNFESLGIGGMDEQLVSIFRDALSTRALSPEMVNKLGINHAKGILLYGPPGTGKTLIARKIGAILTKRPPKVVNGPEILNKFVGQSEENIRMLFREAEEDYSKHGDHADLHIIIFDEIDAICKQRGSSVGSSGVGDSVVNQLLTKIDGVEEVKNVFLIAMTNRMDLLDPALLRPGRIGKHVRISLPDLAGREQIFRIHTNKMRTHQLLDSGVNLGELARMTENYTGSEIESVVVTATSRAIYETLQVTALNDNVRVTIDHLHQAIVSFKPMFGQSRNTLISLRPSDVPCDSLGRIINYRERLTSGMHIVAFNDLASLVDTLYLESDLTIKILTNNMILALNEMERSRVLSQMLAECHQAKRSVLLIPDADTLIEYILIGKTVHYSFHVLNTLRLIMFTIPPAHTQTLCAINTRHTDVYRYLSEGIMR